MAARTSIALEISRTNLNLVDRFGVSAELVGAYSSAYDQRERLLKRKAELQKQTPDRGMRCDYLRYQVAEIIGAELVAGEDEALLEEKKALQTSESRIRNAQHALEALEGSEGNPGATGSLRSAVTALKALEAQDERLVSPENRWSLLWLQLKDYN